MSRYILTFLNSSLYSKPSGVKLAELMNFTPINSFRNIDSPEVLVRYGITSYPNEDLRFNIIYNKADDLRKTVNKLIFSRYLLSHGYRYTPRIYVNKEEIERFPVLGRRQFHSRGVDIILINNRRELNRSNCDYYVEFIRSTCEYRVHVFKGVPIRIQKKVLRDRNCEEQFIRNVEHGYVLADHYNHNIDIEKKILREAIKVMHILNLDFGALDFLVSEDGVPYVLEVNTAPRLNKFGRQLYAYYFLKDLGDEVDLSIFTRLKKNEGRLFNGLEEIEFRDIVHTDRRNVYE